MTCSSCGTELPPDAMFCGECGRAIATRAGGSPRAGAAETIEAAAEPEPVEAEQLEPEPVEPEPVEPEPVEPEPVEPKPVEPEPERASSPAPSRAADRCAQCDALLAPSDIFCPECGFVRQRESPRLRPSDTNVLDPFPWGLPRSVAPVAVARHIPEVASPEVSAGSAATASGEAAPIFAETADVAATRLVPRGPRSERFVLQFSTGESVSVSGSGLIGRNPVAEPAEYFDTLVSIVDPGRSVSKTHLEFGQDGSSLWVSDRYSGNGTVVREPESEPRRCDAGKRYRVSRGARVDIGEQFFIVS